VLGAELRACGVDLSFTPVLDLDHGGSGVIGDRAFHRDPRVVTMLAKSLMHGLLRAGMANCGKHFPGHGFVKADSHVDDVPVDKRSLKAILADDAGPTAGCHHAGQRDAGARGLPEGRWHRPAGFSARWLKDILRGQLGFTGAIFSDDLSMAGARHPSTGRHSATPRPRRWRSTPAATWCCCATSPWTAAVRSTNCSTAWPRRGRRGRWLLPRPPPTAKRAGWRCCRAAPPLPWDELMHEPGYQHALEQAALHQRRRRRRGHRHGCCCGFCDACRRRDRGFRRCHHRGRRRGGLGCARCRRRSLVLVDVVGRDGGGWHGSQRRQRSVVPYAAFVGRQPFQRRCAFARLAASPTTAAAAAPFTFAAFAHRCFRRATLGRQAVAGFGAWHRRSAVFGGSAIDGAGDRALDVAGLVDPALGPVAHRRGRRGRRAPAGRAARP
jgi:hypothetical protein